MLETLNEILTPADYDLLSWSKTIRADTPEGETWVICPVNSDCSGDNYSEMSVVFCVNYDRIFRKLGTIDSWNGDTWDGPLEEVESETIIRYVPIERDEC